MPVMYHWAEGNIFSVSGNLDDAVSAGRRLGDGRGDEGRGSHRGRWTGEGSSAEADFHHALMFASVYQAPVILNVVNNQWAISTFQGFAGGDGSSSPRADRLRHPRHSRRRQRLPGRVRGHPWAAERARTACGPTLIELVTYRAAAHSTSDDPSRYRPKDEAEQWPLGDPIDA